MSKDYRDLFLNREKQMKIRIALGIELSSEEINFSNSLLFFDKNLNIYKNKDRARPIQLNEPENNQEYLKRFQKMKRYKSQVDNLIKIKDGKEVYSIKSS